MTELPTIPFTLRVHLAHATLQAIAEECGADVLHIKGPAVDPSLRPEGRASVDADVLVRPAHLKRLLRGLKQSGWKQVTTLRSGGVVEHSTNWYHGALGQVDVHVRFPGIQIEPERAFHRLWEGSGQQRHRIPAVPRPRAGGAATAPAPPRGSGHPALHRRHQHRMGRRHRTAASRGGVAGTGTPRGGCPRRGDGTLRGVSASS